MHNVTVEGGGGGGGSGGTVPHILTSVIDGAELSGLHLGRFTKGKDFPYKFNLRFNGPLRRFCPDVSEKRKTCSPLLLIQLPLNGNTARSPVTTPTELPRIYIDRTI